MVFEFGKIKPDMVIEAGHLYLDEIATKEQFEGINVAQKLIEEHKKNYRVKTMLLLDDYNIDEELPESEYYFNWWNYIVQLEKMGYHPLEECKESEFVDEAEGLLARLQTRGLVKENENSGNFVLKKRNVPLWNIEKKKPLCALLDASFYLYKGLPSTTCVTILPPSYKSQQKNTKRILNALDVDTQNIWNYYTGGREE